MVLASPVYIEAPNVQSAPGGLYAVARVIEGDSHVGVSGAQYLSMNCGIPNLLDDPACVSQEERAQKTFDSIDVVSSEPFGIYKGTECHDLGDDDSVWARQGLLLGETVAVERGAMAVTFADAVDLTPTPGTAVPIVEGMAILEGYAASNYGGPATIHMARSTAVVAFAEDLLTADLNYTVHTKQGTPVANGGGYEDNLGPDGAPAAEGEAWMYVTGPVTVVRTPVVSNRVLGASEGLNVQNALAERMVTVVVECILAAVLVEVTNG